MNNPFKKFREIQRGKFRPISVAPGDTLELTYIETWTDAKGKVVSRTETVLLNEKITEVMIVDEAVAFRGEYEDRQALGGMFLEKEKHV